MQTSRIQGNYNVGGIAFTSTVTRSADGQISHVVDLPAGVAGAISATGVDGLPDAHGIEAAAIIDVHWADPADGSHKCRRGLTVDTSNANDIEFDNDPAGEGDALPVADTPCVVGVQVVVATTFSGDLLDMIAAMSTQDGMADFRSAGASVKAAKLASEEAYSWVSGQDVDNPFAGETITKVVLSNGTVTPATFCLGAQYDSIG